MAILQCIIHPFWRILKSKTFSILLFSQIFIQFLYNSLLKNGKSASIVCTSNLHVSKRGNAWIEFLEH